MTTSDSAATMQEMDLTDRIAAALPLEVRADFYRELRHCRSLPENDEMLRILRIMQFLTLLAYQVPERLAAERESLDNNLQSCREALDVIEGRLASLPADVASSISPQKVAGQINESLRQMFVQTTIPETSSALTAAAADLKKSVSAFSEAERSISGTYRGAATDARAAVREIESAILSAAKTSSQAAERLSNRMIVMNWTNMGLCALAFLLIGIALASLK